MKPIVYILGYLIAGIGLLFLAVAIGGAVAGLYAVVGPVP